MSEQLALTKIREAVAEAQEMDRLGPDQFKTGQTHLSPAFREINYKSAFLALAKIFNKVEEAIVTLDKESIKDG
jgi:hypothetical protein